MNISPQELAQRLAEADRRRVALRRATLELAAMGRQRLELRSKRENDDIDLNDPVAVLLAALQALERRGIKAAAYGGLALAEKEPAMKRRNRFPKGWNEAGGRAQFPGLCVLLAGDVDALLHGRFGLAHHPGAGEQSLSPEPI